MIDADVAACYNMSLNDFEHSGVHDLFKVCKLFLLSLFFFFFLFFFFLGMYISSY